MTDHAVRPESTLSLAFQIEQQIHAIGDQTRTAVDQMFQQLAEADWHWRFRNSEATMPVHLDIGECLDFKAGLVIESRSSSRTRSSPTGFTFAKGPRSSGAPRRASGHYSRGWLESLLS